MIYATVVGNLGGDAELRSVNGKSVVNFNVAAKNGFKKDAPPAWVRVAVWGERAPGLAEYLKKGRPVTAIGQLSRREHEGKTYLELDAKEVALQGGKVEATGKSPPADPDEEPPPF